MVTSLSMRSNQTSKNTSQDELWDLMGKSPATHRFLTLFKTPLQTFVGDILEVFKAPKAEGVDFEFVPMIPAHRIPTKSGGALPVRLPSASAIASPA